VSSPLEVLFLPFLACLILTGIHAYLGIHVISRKVIFVDIALAQIAALGGTVAFLLGYDPRSEGAYFFSLAFAVLAAIVFALTRTQHERVPQEAVIGLTYATASAAAILLADISPHGAEHLHDLLAGSIVWVTPPQIAKTAILYSLLGLFHVVFRKRFLQISLHPEEAYAQGVRVRLWDFLFYLSFGVVITSSVQIAGVLLVFCYLVAPSIFAVMFFDSLRQRLITGWTMGTLVSAVGLYFSYDRPSGPTIMVVFAITLLIGGLARSLWPHARAAVPLAATATVMVVLTVAAGALQAHLATPEPGEAAAAAEAAITRSGRDAAPPAEGTQEATHETGTGVGGQRQALRDAHPEVRARAVAELARSGDPRVLHDLLDALSDQDAGVREAAAAAVGQVGGPSAIPVLRQHLDHKDEDPWVRLRLAESLASLGEREGLLALFDLAATGDGGLLRLEALNTLSRFASMKPPVDDPSGDAAQKRLAALRDWWGKSGARLRFDPQTRTFH
jgi:zinc/manganese transport system permease protein